MTGAFKYQESIMSDEMEESSPDSLLGTIIKVLILKAIWPYLLALPAILIAFLIGSVVLAWIEKNWLFTLEFSVGVVVIYGLYRCHLIVKVWEFVFGKVQVTPTDNKVENISNLSERKFIPSSNLYCFLCIKKLGIQSFEINHHFYCKDCSKKITNDE
jgi:hypothetical protein